MDSIRSVVKKYLLHSNIKIGVKIENLKTSEKYELGESEEFIAASIIKVPIMGALLQEVSDGNIKLTELYQLSDFDKVGGAGVLCHLDSGLSITLKDLMTLMIIQSDNTATNILIDRISVSVIQKFMKEKGFHQSNFYNKLMIIPSELKGLNLLNVSEIHEFMKLAIQGKMVSQHVSEWMIQTMKKQQIHYVKAGFPEIKSSDYTDQKPLFEIASKTGNIPNHFHEIGVIYFNGEVLQFTIFSQGMGQNEAMSFFKEIGSALFDYISKGNK